MGIPGILDGLKYQYSRATAPEAVRAAMDLSKSLEQFTNPYGTHTLKRFKEELARHPDHAAQVAGILSNTLKKLTDEGRYNAAAFGLLGVVAKHPEISTRLPREEIVRLGQSIANYAGPDGRQKCFGSYLTSVHSINRGDVTQAIPDDVMRKGIGQLSAYFYNDLSGWKAIFSRPEWKAIAADFSDEFAAKSIAGSPYIHLDDLSTFPKLPNAAHLFDSLSPGDIRTLFNQANSLEVPATVRFVRAVRPDLIGAITEKDFRTKLDGMRDDQYPYMHAAGVLQAAMTVPAWKKSVTKDDVAFFVHNAESVQRSQPNQLARAFGELRNAVGSVPEFRGIVDAAVNKHGLFAQEVGQAQILYYKGQEKPEVWNYNNTVPTNHLGADYKPVKPDESLNGTNTPLYLEQRGKYFGEKSDLLKSLADTASKTDLPDWVKQQAKTGFADIGGSDLLLKAAPTQSPGTSRSNF